MSDNYKKPLTAQEVSDLFSDYLFNYTNADWGMFKQWLTERGLTKEDVYITEE